VIALDRGELCVLSSAPGGHVPCVQFPAPPGGTAEVFRTIIAQHDLGLPRPDSPGRTVFLPPGRPAAA
jgi:hypothetical protein